MTKVQMLLVEDDPAQLNALAERLRVELKYEVKEVTSVQEGIAIFTEFADCIDLVIADMHFGSSDPKCGLRLITQLSKQLQTNCVPVIVMTAYSDMQNAAECMEAGAFSYVVKAVLGDSTFRTLRETISRALELRDERLGTDTMAKAICEMVDCHEPYTGGHCERVGAYAKLIAGKANLSEPDRAIAWRAGLVHDLGKVGMDAGVLARPARLSAVLMAAINAHPVE